MRPLLRYCFPSKIDLSKLFRNVYKLRSSSCMKLIKNLKKISVISKLKLERVCTLTFSRLRIDSLISTLLTTKGCLYIHFSIRMQSGEMQKSREQRALSTRTLSELFIEQLGRVSQYAVDGFYMVNGALTHCLFGISSFTNVNIQRIKWHGVNF